RWPREAHLSTAEADSRLSEARCHHRVCIVLSFSIPASRTLAVADRGETPAITDSRRTVIKFSIIRIGYHTYRAGSCRDRIRIVRIRTHWPIDSMSDYRVCPFDMVEIVVSVLSVALADRRGRSLWVVPSVDTVGTRK